VKIVVTITGASGVELAKRFIEYLPDTIDTHVVVSDHSLVVESFEGIGVSIHRLEDIAASISSGSFGVDATVILPCSMNTLAKVACGISDNLVTRVAAVAIKEQKKLPIALENMHKLSTLGVIIAPPVLGYYSDSSTLEEAERFIIGKWYDLLGIENDIYKRWEGHDE